MTDPRRAAARKFGHRVALGVVGLFFFAVLYSAVFQRARLAAWPDLPVDDLPRGPALAVPLLLAGVAALVARARPGAALAAQVAAFGCLAVHWRLAADYGLTPQRGYVGAQFYFVTTLLGALLVAGVAVLVAARGREPSRPLVEFAWFQAAVGAAVIGVAVWW